MKRFTSDLCRWPTFIAMLRRYSRAEDFALVYDVDYRIHWATFTAWVWGWPWALKIPIVARELDITDALGLIDFGNRMIQDVEAHYRQLAVAA